MKAYEPKKIEPKWQKIWDKEKAFSVEEDSKKEKFYALIEFPYPSGAGLHVGHPRPFTAMDVISRKKRMEGYNVLYPIGFDAFGLPTENYAIKTGRPPAEVTAENIATFTRQLKSLGYSFDWDRAVDTTDPEYYRWTQWIFLQFFKHGLAYKKNQPINWCPKDKIGLANEEVVNGCCERCGTPTEKRNKEQWMLAITKYADKLLEGLKEVDYITPARVQQENWIGKSEGAVVKFQIPNTKYQIEVFTTRLDTIFSGTFLILAPEHPLVGALTTAQQKNVVEAYKKDAVKQTQAERTNAAKEKTGVFTGAYAENPATGDKMPVWISDFVLANYGTGAVFADAHDERDFAMAKKYNLPLKVSIRPANDVQWKKVQNLAECFPEDGTLVNSGQFDGFTSKSAREKILSWLEKDGKAKRQVQFKLRDWVFSRQRYWGEPIPLVFCEACAKTKKFEGKGEEMNPGWVADENLPLKLPKVKKYEPTDTGESPLAAMEKWVNTKCPRCGGKARRETDTMPNWAGSSWYFLRYCDPHNDKEFASMKKLKYWLGSPKPDAKPGEGGVDWYNGGMEHTVLHLLYSRFWNQFLFDIGVVPTREPYKKRTSHGMILGPDGEKMSKSRGNVINPDEMVEKFGTDAFRTYIMFMGPFDQAVMWDTNGLVGVRRFLDKVWNLQEGLIDSGENKQVIMHQTIKKVTEDIDKMAFNTAIAKMMELANHFVKEQKITKEEYGIFAKLLSLFAPHIAEEIWTEVLGHKKSLAYEPWPTFKPELTVEATFTLAVQINGKVRDTVEVATDALEENVKQAALASEKVQKWLEGKMPKKVIYVKGKLVSIVI